MRRRDRGHPGSGSLALAREMAMSRTCTRDAAGQAMRGAAIPSKIHTLSSSGVRCVATARMRARLVVTQCGRPGDLAFTLINSVSQSKLHV